MATFPTLSLFYTLALLSSFFPLNSAAELATEVCKNTTDFDFCHAALYSDPRAATADQYELIDLVFRTAFRNATDTREYIATIVKSGGENPLKSLKKCVDDYSIAIQTISEVLNDLNSDTYYELDIFSLKVESSVRNCTQGLQSDSIIKHRNENMLKLSNICYVTSLLFYYS